MLKQSLNVELSEEDERELESAAADIVKLYRLLCRQNLKVKEFANHVLTMICAVFEVIKCRKVITYIRQAI